MLSAAASRSTRQRAGVLRTVRAGFAHHQAGRLDRAEALYRRAVEKDPDDANALRDVGRLAEAVESYGRALALKPDFGMAHSNLACVLNQQGKFAAALE